MKVFRGFVLLTALLVSQTPSQAVAGLFKMDFGELENINNDIELEDWDVFETFSFFDFDDEIPVFSITDWSGDGDDDVTLNIFDNLELADEFAAEAQGMISNNPVPQLEEVVYDGIFVPAEVKDDYLYRDPDTAGTELLFRFDNLDPGSYNVTLFLGRTSDANGQFGKIWVDNNAEGAGEPEDENTGNFAGFDPATGEEEPEGFPVTIPVEIKAGEFLWYGHMEDNSGGISGIIIRRTKAGGLVGDFDGNGVLDAADIDDLTKQSAGGTNPADYDLTADGVVDAADVTFWIRDLFNSWVGDVNLDNEFDSGDLVQMLASGTYETGGDSVWSLGDLNGDGRTDSADLVAGLADGGYEAGPRAAVAAVPEPTSITLLALGMLLAVCLRRGR